MRIFNYLAPGNALITLAALLALAFVGAPGAMLLLGGIWLAAAANWLDNYGLES
jgi:hypothetical protein